MAKQLNTTHTSLADARKLLKLAEVRDRTTLSTSEIYRRIAADRFPRQIRLGAKSVAWLESDIQKWIDEQIALSSAGVA